MSAIACEKTAQPLPDGVDTTIKALIDEIFSGQGLPLNARATQMTRVERHRFSRFDCSAEIGAANSKVRTRMGVFYNFNSVDGVSNIHDFFGETANQLIGRIASLIDDGYERLRLSQPMTVFWADDDFGRALAPARGRAQAQLWRIENRPARFWVGLQLAIRDEADAVARLSDVNGGPKAGAIDFF